MSKFKIFDYNFFHKKLTKEEIEKEIDTLAQTNINTSGGYIGGNILHYLVTRYSGGHEDIRHLIEYAIGYAIQKGADKNIKDTNGNTPLHLFSYLNTTNIKIFNMLITKENFIAQNNGNNTALQQLVRNNYSSSPEMLTIFDNSKEVIEYYIENIENIENIEFMLILKYICRLPNYSDETITQLINRKDFNVKFENQYKETPLHIASNYGRSNIVEIILSKDKTILNNQNVDGDTPLHLACYGNHKTTIEILLNKNDIDVNIQNNHNQDTTLHIACANKNIDIVQLLLNHNANVNIERHYGETPLHIVCQNECTEIVKLLIDHNANVGIKNEGKDTPLHIAIKKRNNEIVKALLNSKIKFEINETDEQYKTPLALAKLHNLSDEVINLIASKGGRLDTLFTDFIDIDKDLGVQQKGHQEKASRFFWGFVFEIVIVMYLAYERYIILQANITFNFELVSLHILASILIFTTYRGYIRNQMLADYYNHKRVSLQLTKTMIGADRNEKDNKWDDLIIHNAKDNPLDVFQKSKNGELDADHMVQLITSIQNALKK